MKQCNKCKYYFQIYLKMGKNYVNDNCGKCSYKSKLVANTYICTNYEEEEIECQECQK